MTDPRQPGSTNNWSSRYPATYNGDGDHNGYNGYSGRLNGYAQTEVDDLEGLGQDDEIGVPRGGTNGSYERYWQAPQTLAPDYDQLNDANDPHFTDAETQQGLSAASSPGAGLNGSAGSNGSIDSNGSAGSNGSAADPDATAWWNNAELAARSDGSAASPWGAEETVAGSALGPSLGQQPAFDAGPKPASDWESQLGYDSGATVATSAVTGSWAGAPGAAERDYPASEGYSVGSVASAAESRTEASSRTDKSTTGPRRARLMLRHIDPLSTLKFTLVLTIAMFVVWMVAVGVLYGVLNGMGVFGKINGTINDVNGSDSNVITAQIVFGAAAVIGAVNIILFTALATVGSFIYNLCADMVGGLEVTLSERD